MVFSEIQKRLHEVIEREPFPEPRRFRKEAVLVGDDLKRQQEVSAALEGSSLMDKNQKEEQAEARRRRIYENQYNRPYPTTRKNSFWSDDRSTTSAVSMSALTPSRKSAAQRSLVTPSPTHQQRHSFKFKEDNDKENTQNDIPAIKSATKNNKTYSKPSLVLATPPRPHVQPLQVVTPLRRTSSISSSVVPDGGDVSPLTTPQSSSPQPPQQPGLMEDLLFGATFHTACAPLQPVLDSTGIQMTASAAALDLDTLLCREEGGHDLVVVEPIPPKPKKLSSKTEKRRRRQQ